MDQNNSLPEVNGILRKRSLTDEVYDFLAGKIIAGKYSAGDWLRQEDISTLLGVSQTPVREALDRLVASGLAERVPYRGVRVPILETGEIIDAFLLRIVLETTGVRLAAKLIQPEEIRVLSDLVEKTAGLMTLEDMSSLRQLNKQIHMRMVEAAGNNLLNKLYEMTTNAFPDWMLYEYMFRHPELLASSLKRELEEHKAIVAALAAHDSKEAANQVITHIKNLLSDLRSILEFSDTSIEEIEQQINALMTNS